MSNPNMMTVYDPEGTAFEVSPLNAKDLVQINGWTFTKPVIKIVEAPATPKLSSPPPEENEPQNPDEVDDADGDEDGDADAEAAPFTTVEAFERYPNRPDMVAYLKEHFPDFTPHHLAKRDTLVEKAIELAKAGE